LGNPGAGLTVTVKAVSSTPSAVAGREVRVEHSAAVGPAPVPDAASDTETTVRVGVEADVEAAADPDGDVAGDTEAIWLGVDLGTQGVRVLAATGAGRVVARAAVALTSTRDGNRHEQDPEDWWSAFVRAAGSATRDLDSARIRGLSVCSTSGTVLFVEPAGAEPARPVTPALMYDDGRAGDYAERAAARPAPGWTAAGATPQASWGLAKALWLLDHCRVPPGARLAHQADLVTSRLVGVPVATDWSHALKSGVDLESGDWPADVLSRCGLDATRLPPVVPPGSPLGSVGVSAAALTGIPAGTPVFAGLTDGCAAQVASGALAVGSWNFVLGTTLVLKGTTKEPLRDPSGAVYSHRSPDGSWWPGGASSAGAGVLAEEFGAADLASLDEAAAGREPAGCLRYPLVGTGERFPFRRTDATGFTVGSPRDDADRYAALLQGVAFVERLSLEHVRGLGASVGTSVRLTGGGTRSAYWCQLQADILGGEVVVPEVADGAFGMAVVAARSAYGSLEDAAARMVRVRSRFAPRPEASERLSEAYVRWRAELRSRGWLGAPDSR
jgi:D-ribulokinase